ncbi:transmembrane protein 201 [Pelobates fuscus]|uniref:transmembrane protein 201 n=1 Tax=Pelobates fuscus TaxID=191477 RepID=UPI002FE4E87E
MEVGISLPWAGLAAVAATGVTGAFIYNFGLKRPSHVKVNCWFCNQDTFVPYGNRNCWDCPSCEQYNGFKENGDYNKPIPAQHHEHLNHVVSGGSHLPDVIKPQQWVNCQTLLCKKCNVNQNTIIKQLASFVPRDDNRYDEEIEVYKHHLEQTYKLCRPCQAAVECYIKHQNRQLRAHMLNQHLKHRETDKYHIKSFGPSISCQVPMHILILRLFTFLSCLFLLWLNVFGPGDLFIFSTENTNISEEPIKSPLLTFSSDDKLNGFWMAILKTAKILNEAWCYGQTHPMEVALLGTCASVLAFVSAGPIRLRRIDALATFLWMMVASVYVIQRYLLTEFPTLDSARLGVTSLCCLACCISSMTTYKVHKKKQLRRIVSKESNCDSFVGTVPINPGVVPASTPILFTPPELLLQLMKKQKYESQLKDTTSSLHGRLSKALSLGTIPSLSRTDSGYLFSGSRPPSVASTYKGQESAGSDYYSLLSGSRASTPLPSPTPSIAGSAISSSGSMYHRRPLISPARLNLHGQKLGLSHTSLNGNLTRNSSEDSSCYPDSTLCLLEIPQFVTKHYSNARIPPTAYSVSNNTALYKEENSSQSSTCPVDTTTGFMDSPKIRQGFCGIGLIHGFFVISLTLNLLFLSFYLHPLVISLV